MLKPLDKKQLDLIIDGLMNGDVIELGAGYDLELEHDVKDKGSEKTIHNKYYIYNSTAFRDTVLYVDNQLNSYGPSYETENSATFHISGNVKHENTKLILSALEDILTNTVPQLFENHIKQTEKRIEDIKNQHEQRSTIFKSFIEAA